MGFFLKFLVLFYYITATIPNGEAANDVKTRCKDGWTPFKTKSRACIRIIKTEIAPDGWKYEDAKALCKFNTAEIHESLVTIANEKDQKFIEEFIKSERIEKDIWIGLEQDINGNYTWPDEMELKYTNWGVQTKEEISKIDGGHHCIELSVNSENKGQFGKWFRRSCLEEKLPLCEEIIMWSYLRMQSHLISLEERYLRMQSNFMRLEQQFQNIIPVGMVYVQLPKTDSPKLLWPWIEWVDVTKDYAGVFFRAEGGSSGKFNEIQNATTLPRLFVLNGRVNHRPNLFSSTIFVPSNGSSSNWLLTGFENRTAEFETHSARVMSIKWENAYNAAPKNMAIKIYKRLK